jgi:plasmid stabilization system protein ParE
MTRYRILSPAQDEIAAAALFYEDASSGLGEAFLDDVRHVIDRLCQYPDSGVIVRGSLRGVLLSRFPFRIIYSVEGDSILVVAVAHQRRRPGYWIERRW